MTDQMDTIREDLAFMKSLASDDGRTPGLVGAHFLAAGLIWGLPLFPVWAILRGYLDWPQGWTSYVSLYSTAVYVPVAAWLSWKGRRAAPVGPSVRAFAAVWAGVGLTTLTMVFVIFWAGARLHVPQIWQVWTSICFAIYGGAWLGIAIARRNNAWALVAVGSYLNAVVNAFLIGGPDVLLGCAVGIILWLAVPGAVLLWRARAPA